MLISFDLECSGLKFYSPDFKVISAAFSYRDTDNKIKTLFFYDKDEIESVLLDIKEKNHTLVVFSQSYENGVLTTQFPKVLPIPMIDCQRLCQLAGLSPDLPKKDRRRAYSLSACAERILNYPDWKKKFKSYVKEFTGCKRGTEMEQLDKIPKHKLEEYNAEDTVVTLRLFEVLSAHYKEINYDYSYDLSLYNKLVKHCTEATIRGIKVDREGLQKYKLEVGAEIQEIENQVLTVFANEILTVRQMLLDKVNAKLKKRKRTELPVFNVNSKDHLAKLCIDVLRMTAYKFTKTGKPSFKACDLDQWGKVGKILMKKGKRGIVLNQVEGLLAESEQSGRLHPNLRLISTVTGRLANGSN
jgi:DNA polymerase I-like protein with 3'-5' exonuclease and polymerase domains